MVLQTSFQNPQSLIGGSWLPFSRAGFVALRVLFVLSFF